MERYREVAGGVATKTARTPFVNGDGPKGKTRDPARSRETSRQWRGCMGVDDTELEILKEEPHPIGEEPGELAGQAATALMKRSSAARMARFNLPLAAQGLARYLTRWTKR